MSVNASRPGHATHDELLVVAFASGDLAGADVRRADALVAACPDCAALDADIRALRAATAGIARHHRPRRRRDFRLASDAAARLRPASPWRRLVAAIASPRAGLLTPLGGTVAALGLVGILVSAPIPIVPGISDFGAAGAAPALEAAPERSSADAAAGAGASAFASGAAPSADRPLVPTSSATEGYATGAGPVPVGEGVPDDPRIPLSVGLLVAGIALAGARPVARTLQRR